MPTAADRAIAAHRAEWGRPTLVARAPGRVNLIGEHTDYNEGFALPMALEFDTVVALDDRGDRHRGTVTAFSDEFGAVDIDPERDPTDVPTWARHLSGVVRVLRDTGIPAAGWRGAVATDVPVGAGLSSSAALEVALITALLERAGELHPPLDVALLGQRVENEVVGVPSGIMDQLISAGAIAGHASLIDCRHLTLDPTPMPDGVVVAVIDTGTRRALADGGYAERRAACERASAEIGFLKLRDATLADLDGVTDPTDRRRAHHVVSENERTLAAAAAMRAGRADELGELMRASHRSLRDQYAVSAPGLDAAVEAAEAAPGCLGARLTGGGFGGCVVALVDADARAAFVAAVIDGYRYGGHTARVWACSPAPGAGLLTA